MNTITNTIRKKTAQFKSLHGVNPNAVFVSCEAYQRLGEEAGLKFPITEALGMNVFMTPPYSTESLEVGVGLCLDHPMEK